MCTVPAQSFCAPTRAKLIAALRSMPGVCAVFGSSRSPGTTRTPSCFQRAGFDACESEVAIDALDLVVRPDVCNGADSATPRTMLLWGSAQHTTGDKAF